MTNDTMQAIRDEGDMINLFDNYHNGYVDKYQVYPSALKLINENRITLKRLKEIAWMTCRIPSKVVDDRLLYIKLL